MALHIRILASGSFLTISRTASMPPISGITISIVTRSGLSWRYFSTACVPVSASPTTSNPACARISVIIVRMKMASSQTRTVWLTARSLSGQNRTQQCRHVQYDEQFTVTPPHRANQCGIDARETRAVFQHSVARPPRPPRHARRQHVHHLVNGKADQLFAAVARVTMCHLEDNRRSCRGFGCWCRGTCGWSGRRGGRDLPQRTPPFHDRHQCAADIHEPRHDRGRARDTRRWEARENLPHLVHLSRARQSSDSEHEQAGGDEASFIH